MERRRNKARSEKVADFFDENMLQHSAGRGARAI
jgi:hypothetical protein